MKIGSTERLKVFTKGEYILHNMIAWNKSKEYVYKQWEKVSNGHSFIVGQDLNDIYSVEYLDDNVK